MTITTDCYTRQHNWVCEHILAALPGADPNQVQRVFVRKADYFIQESASWIDDATFTCDEFGNVFADFSSINGQAMWIHEVWHEARPLSHRNLIPEPYKTRQASTPIQYTTTPYSDVLVLNPLPLDSDNLFTVLVRASLKMSDCTSADVCIPDWIFTRYKEDILSGVLGEMMRESGKSYTNLSEGRLRSQQYKYGIVKARDEAKRGFGENESEWSIPQGFYV